MVFTEPREKIKGRLSIANGFVEVTAVYDFGENVLAIHKDRNEKEIKRIHFNQKILHLLFPNRFPDFMDSASDGKNAFTLRRKIIGRKLASNEIGNLSTVTKLLRDFDVPCGIENKYGSNVFEEEDGNCVYVDTHLNLLRSEQDLANVLLLAEHLGISADKKREIKTYGERSLANI